MDPAADLAAILNHLDRDVYLQATGKTLCKLSGAQMQLGFQEQLKTSRGRPPTALTPAAGTTARGL
jgi:hypothetical protein